MRRIILLLGTAAIALTACSEPTVGTPAPTSGGTTAPRSSTVDQLPGPGVPKVANPIDLAQIKQAPCNALTDTQAKELLGPEVEVKPDPEGPAGPACGWKTPTAVRPRVNVIFDKSTNRGMTAVYEAKGNAYKFVEPLEPIDGYPIAAFGVEDERASKGKCLVSLGTSDREVITIVAEQSEANVGKKDPCAVAREAAIRVLATVRGVS
jgi:hypothetical protein